MERPPSELYDARLSGRLALVLVFVLCLQWAGAQPDFASPRPAPTDAVKASGQTFRSEGRAPVTQGKDKARYAALLDAYRNLMVEGLEQGLFPGGWGELPNSHRMFRIDQDHPKPEIFAWITRCKVVKEETSQGDRVLTVQSPSRGELSSARPEFRAVESMDVDGDGLTDTVSIGYDGAIYIQKPVNGQWKTLSASPSYGSFEIVSGPGLERVRSVLPLSIVHLEVTSGGQVRVLMEMESAEMVNGYLMGAHKEQREVLVSLEKSEDNIRFSIDEPPDFAKLLDPQTELRGHTISQLPLESLEIRHNGELSWESPAGLKTTGLRFNLARPLDSGWNLFRVTARDEEGFLKRRDLWLYGPEQAPAAVRKPKRAILLPLDSSLKEDRVMEELRAAGFSPDMVTVIEPAERSAEGLLQALRDAREAEDLFFYCEAKSRLGDLLEGKTLDFEDGRIGPNDLAQAFDGGKYRRVVMVLHSEVLRGTLGRRKSDEVWRDTTSFLDRLGDGGRLIVGNLEDDELNVRTQRRHSRERFRAALRASEGSDLQRLFDSEDSRNTVFRGWMYGSTLLN